MGSCFPFHQTRLTLRPSLSVHGGQLSLVNGGKTELPRPGNSGTLDRTVLPLPALPDARTSPLPPSRQHLSGVRSDVQGSKEHSRLSHFFKPRSNYCPPPYTPLKRSPRSTRVWAPGTSEKAESRPLPPSSCAIPLHNLYMLNMRLLAWRT